MATVKKAAKAAAEKKPTGNTSVARKVAQGPQGNEYAVNGVKLQRAQKWVRENPETRTLAGEAKEAAIKERYIAIGGLLRDDEGVAMATASVREENLADNDEDEAA